MTATTSFAQACGQLRPLRLAVEHADGGRIADGELAEPFAVIGSSSACEVALHHDDIPERLACLQVIDGQAFVVSLDGFAVHRLTPESPLLVGPFAVRLFEPRSGEPLPIADPLRDRVSDRQFPHVRLTCRNDPAGPAPMELDRRLTFLVARAVPVAYLTLTRDGVFVTDLLSPVGTRVNGEAVRAARLSGGDVLSLGPVQYDVTVGEVDGRWRGEVGAAGVDPEEPVVPLVPTLPAVQAYPSNPEVDPGDTRREAAGLQRQWIDQFRWQVEAMLADFGHLRREQLAALRDEMAVASESLAGLARAREASGVTTLPQQPVERPLIDSGEGLPTTEESAAVHLALYDRLAGLERERIGLWKRLRGLLGG